MVDYERADKLGLKQFEDESFVIGDIFIQDLRTYYESEKKGLLIINMVNATMYEIEMSLDKFRAFLKFCGHTIVEEVPENTVITNPIKKEWNFTREYIKASSE
jgi:hypothetical protein